MIDKVIKTNYDGYIVVRYWSGNVKAFEGIGVCPASVKKYLDTHNVDCVDYTWRDAVSYGII